MSGIVGIYYLDGRHVDHKDLRRMVDRLEHRGPDGEGIWYKGSIGLGHRMLWTTPESLKEKLPLVYRNGKLVITADARIDNRDELISSLDIKNRPLGDITDSEIILDSYEKWGEGCPEKLIGDFAFAIWDGYNQKLFCARDTMGIKPFYYYKSDKLFVFASEIKALLCLKEVPRKLNELMVAFYLARIFKDNNITFYQDIVRLPAVHSLNVNKEILQLRKYFSFSPYREIKLSSDNEYADAFREVFTEAVRCRLRSAFLVGSTLSGGLDSSSICCTARNLLLKNENVQGQLHTYSAIFPSLPEEDLKKIDERKFINAVLSKGDFIPHFIHADEIGPLTEIDRLLWHKDDAFIGPNMFIHWAMHKEAQQNNNRVFLDGIDGDTTISYGLDYVADIARSLRWIKLYKEAIAFSKITNRDPRTFIWRYGFKPLIPKGIIKLGRMLRGQNQTDWKMNTDINPSFANYIQLEEHIKSLSNNRSIPYRTSREKQWHSFNDALIQHGMEILDSSASAFSVEARYPFFDRRLMELSLALPPEQKFKNGWIRAIHRNSMSGILPKEVQWRKGKANLNPNFQRKLLEYGKDLLDKVIVKDPQLIDNYINISTLKERYNRYSSQPTIKNQDALSIYVTVTFSLWLNEAEITI